MFRRNKYEGGLDTFFDESIIVDAGQDDAEGYYMPFKWSRRVITTAALAGSAVICYGIYEFSTGAVAPIISQELGPAPSPSTSSDMGTPAPTITP